MAAALITSVGQTAWGCASWIDETLGLGILTTSHPADTHEEEESVDLTTLSPREYFEPTDETRSRPSFSLSEGDREKCLGIFLGMLRAHEDVKILTLSPDRAVVLKTTEDPKEVEKTMRAASKGLAPHVYCVGKVSKTFYCVMEKYKRDLLELASDKTASFKYRLFTAYAFAKKLFEYHQALGPHGDVKPENVVEREGGKSDDFVRIIDHQYEGKIYTINYLSPERAFAFYKRGPLSKDLLLADDVYAAGITVFEILTGISPDAENEPKGGTEGELNRAFVELIKKRSDPTFMRGEMDFCFKKNITVPLSARSGIMDALAGAFLGKKERISMETLAGRVHRLYQDLGELKEGAAAAASAADSFV